MRKLRRVGLTLCLALAAAAVAGMASQQTPRRIGLNQVENFRGQLVSACGWVTTHDCDHEEGVTVLDLDKPYWSDAVGILISAVNKWRFKPGTASGRPVPVIVTIEMLFTLK